MVSKPAFTSTPSSVSRASLNEAMGATVFMISCVITRNSLFCEDSSLAASRRSKMPLMRLRARLSADFSLKWKFNSPSSRASIMKPTFRASFLRTMSAVTTIAATTATTTTHIQIQTLIFRIPLGGGTRSVG